VKLNLEIYRDDLRLFFLLGSCFNHILHNGVKHGHKLLTIDIEKNLLNIYTHFSRSAKRIAELKSYYQFYEQDYMVREPTIQFR
jgi:hypothetical protein